MIKRFETFKNPTYFEIDEVEAVKLVSSTRRILNRYVRSTIASGYEKFTKDEIKRIKPLTPKNCSMGEFEANINFVPRHSVISEIIMWKCPDEWYVVEIFFMVEGTYGGSVVDGSYWKCDQLDGLVDFLRSPHLKKILNNKKS